MNSYPESIRFLYDLQRFGIKLGLSGIRQLLGVLGNPHRMYPCIHVAGSNGKGSTAAILAAIFTAACYRTGLYTSPHLVDFRERIRVDGKVISKKAVVGLTKRLQPAIEARKSTFFEATTAMAFEHFAQSNVDIAIIETGLGGRLDATNIIRPLVSVITNISLEHSDMLGNSIEKIAYEKAGIIKPRVPCVTGAAHASALKVLRKIAVRRRAPWHHADRAKITVLKSTIDGMLLDVKLSNNRLTDVKLSLAGSYQIPNLTLALSVLDLMRERRRFQIDDSAIRRGLQNVQRLTGLEGRLSVKRRMPLVITDVAHNADGASRLAGALKELGIIEVFLVFGVLRDKDYASMIRQLAPLTRKAVVVAPETDRARAVEDLVREFRKQSIPVEREQSVTDGTRRSLKFAPRSVPRLITGSHFVVAEAMQYLGKKNT